MIVWYDLDTIRSTMDNFEYTWRSRHTNILSRSPQNPMNNKKQLKGLVDMSTKP
jgi:hypothetical protein